MPLTVVVVKEVYTGTKFQGRKEPEKLLEKVQSGDTIIFDSVSRMSRDSEGALNYFRIIVKKKRKIDFIRKYARDAQYYLKYPHAMVVGTTRSGTSMALKWM